MVKVKVQYFGAFRKFGTSCILDVSDGSSIKHLKEALVAHLGETQRALIEDSVLADNTDILVDNAVITGSEEFSILPPVCGG